MPFTSFPVDLLIEIGLWLDWETLHQCYRLLSKRFYRLCQDGFWRKKYSRDFGNHESEKEEFYPNSFYFYLAEESRKLMVEEGRYFHINTLRKKDQNLKTRIIVTGIKLNRIQNILLNYLTTKHGNCFKSHVLDLDGIMKGGEIPAHVKKYHLLIDEDLEMNENLGSPSFSIFMDSERLPRVRCRSGHEMLPDFFYEFIWSLGLSPSNARKLYSFGQEVPLARRGPYQPPEGIINFYVPQITKDEILRYFGSQQEYKKFIRK